MPIYAYRCSNCGHAQDVLQKISDPVLTVCPACGQASYVKQVTAAGFQLKGSGWYVTDFRGDGKAGKAADAAAGDKAADKAGGDKPAGEAASKSDAGNGDGAKKAENAPAAAPAPAAASPAAAAPAPGSAGKTGG